MLLTLLAYLLISNALIIRKDKSILLSRIVMVSLGLWGVFTVKIFFMLSLDKAFLSGLHHVTVFTQYFNMFMLLNMAIFIFRYLHVLGYLQAPPKPIIGGQMVFSQITTQVVLQFGAITVTFYMMDGIGINLSEVVSNFTSLFSNHTRINLPDCGWANVNVKILKFLDGNIKAFIGVDMTQCFRLRTFHYFTWFGSPHVQIYAIFPLVGIAVNFLSQTNFYQLACNLLMSMGNLTEKLKKEFNSKVSSLINLENNFWVFMTGPSVSASLSRKGDGNGRKPDQSWRLDPSHVSERKTRDVWSPNIKKLRKNINSFEQILDGFTADLLFHGATFIANIDGSRVLLLPDHYLPAYAHEVRTALLNTDLSLQVLIRAITEASTACNEAEIKLIKNNYDAPTLSERLLRKFRELVDRYSNTITRSNDRNSNM